MTDARIIQTRPWIPFWIRRAARCSASWFAPASVFSIPPQTITAPQIAIPRPIAIATRVAIIFVTGASASWAPWRDRRAPRTRRAGGEPQERHDREDREHSAG